MIIEKDIIYKDWSIWTCELCKTNFEEWKRFQANTFKDQPQMTVCNRCAKDKADKINEFLYIQLKF